MSELDEVKERLPKDSGHSFGTVYDIPLGYCCKCKICKSTFLYFNKKFYINNESKINSWLMPNEDDIISCKEVKIKGIVQ